jgi:hypothetical protein
VPWPSLVNRSNVTAVRRTLEFQKPNAVCRIASGVGEVVFTILDVANLLGVTSHKSGFVAVLVIT